ncbi:MAG: sigma-70 family RNA polymerase sigma factor [Planctomycetaceae bacterium]|nr:MAG: sigma-70 family RNA polymerase sigma factor [Planctomycetaceae bacterium]
MNIGATTLGLGCNALAAEEVCVSQRWILASMQKHGPALVAMLWRILGNEQDVCDAYQDTFVQLANRSQAEVPKDIRAYVFRCAANTAVTLLRRRRRHDVAVRQAAQDAHQYLSADPSQDIDQQQLRQCLRDSIACLPDKLREVILLKDLAELPYEQVARMLGISVASARVYRCRAIQLLGVGMARREEGRL